MKQPSVEELIENVRADESLKFELFKQYPKVIIDKCGFRPLDMVDYKNMFNLLFEEGLINNENKEDFFYILDIIFFTHIMIEAKKLNYSSINKKKTLKQKINNIKNTYSILDELEILGVENDSLVSIQKTKKELEKLLLDLECLKDNIKEVDKDSTLSLFYNIKTYSNIKNTRQLYLAPYKDDKSLSNKKKVLSNDYSNYIEVLENKTITREYIIRLSSTVFIDFLDNTIGLSKKLEFTKKIYSHFFDASESLIDNRKIFLKFHILTVKFTEPFRPIGLSTEQSSTTKEFTLKH